MASYPKPKKMPRIGVQKPKFPAKKVSSAGSKRGK